jgi:hypothetical protein
MAAGCSQHGRVHIDRPSTICCLVGFCGPYVEAERYDAGLDPARLTVGGLTPDASTLIANAPVGAFASACSGNHSVRSLQLPDWSTPRMRVEPSPESDDHGPDRRHMIVMSDRQLTRRLGISFFRATRRATGFSPLQRQDSCSDRRIIGNRKANCFRPGRAWSNSGGIGAAP